MVKCRLIRAERSLATLSAGLLLNKLFFASLSVSNVCISHYFYALFDIKGCNSVACNTHLLMMYSQSR